MLRVLLLLLLLCQVFTSSQSQICLSVRFGGKSQKKWTRSASLCAAEGCGSLQKLKKNPKGNKFFSVPKKKNYVNSQVECLNYKFVLNIGILNENNYFFLFERKRSIFKHI